MDILLISPRLALQKGDFLGSGVPYWPVELAILASFLKERGNGVVVADLFGNDPSRLEDRGDHFLQGASIAEWLSSRKGLNADLIVVFAISYMSHFEILNIVRYVADKYKGAKVLVLENSQAVTAYSVESLKGEFFDAGADGVICGEPYWNWEEIEDFIMKGRGLQPQNLICPDERRELRGRIVNKYPSYPYPAWEMFELENYWNLPYSHGPKRHKRYLPVFTSRGCPYPCDFCVVPETNNRFWRGRSPQEVVDEFEYLKNRFGVRYFQIEDLNPTVKSTRWEEISKLLIKRGCNIEFGFVSGTKAETVKIDSLELLYQAGCRYISISPESGSPDVMRKIGKPFNYDHALELVRECSRLGIYTQACFLVGHPAETLEDHRRSCQYLKDMVRAGLDETAIFIVSSLAGSRIYKENAIHIRDKKSLPSFSPKGRADWEQLVRWRSERIRIFFLEKLKRGAPLFVQGWRALFGRPATKMENLPKRILYIYGCIVKYHINRLFKAIRTEEDVEKNSGKMVRLEQKYGEDKAINE